MSKISKVLYGPYKTHTEDFDVEQTLLVEVNGEIGDNTDDLRALSTEAITHCLWEMINTLDGAAEIAEKHGIDGSQKEVLYHMKKRTN